MKKFRITEYKPIMAYWYYEVEAETEEQALEKIYNGEVDSTDYETGEDYSDDSEFHVEEIKKQEYKTYQFILNQIKK